MEGDDSVTSSCMLDEQDCLEVLNPYGAPWIYIQVPSQIDYEGSITSVEVDLYANREAKVWVEYDSTDPEVFVIEGAPGAFKRTSAQTISGTGDWRRLCFTITDPYFKKRVNGADFRVVVTGEAGEVAYFRRISIHTTALDGAPEIEHDVYKPIVVNRSDKPRVTVIVPTFNRSEYTLQCIRYMAKHAPEAKFELLIVDNDSSPAEFERISKVRGAEIVQMRYNTGFAKACNTGAMVARGEFLLFLNNDTIPMLGWLDQLLSSALSNPKDGVFGSKLMYPETCQIQHAGVAFDGNCLPYHEYEFMSPTDPRVSTERVVPAVTGASMMVRRDHFLNLGGFDEGFRNGYEDIDFCLRSRSQGAAVRYCPKSELFHYQSVSEGRTDSETECQNRARFLNRWANRLP